MRFNINFKNFNLISKRFILFYLLIASYLIQFILLKHFGLYEDDYWSIAPAYKTTLSDLINKIINCFIYWPTGRPLNHILPLAYGYVGHQLGGLSMLYLLACIWLGFNAWLIYCIARHWLNAPSAFIAGLIYISFPADTTHQLLTHVSHVQGAMTFMLLGWLLWLKENRTRWLSYPISSLALLSYETAFIAFIAAPLFGKKNSKISESKIWFEHIIGCSIILSCIGFIRIHLSDTRAISILGTPKDAILKAITSCILGPITIIRANCLAISTGWKFFNSVSITASLLIVIFILIITKYDNLKSDQKSNLTNRVILGALLTLPLSYILTLVNYPPTQLAGRLTSTHVAAAFPWSITIGILYYISSKQVPYIRNLLYFTYSLILFLLIGYNYSIQANYCEASKLQKSFWQQILNLTPDIRDNTSIIVAGTPSLGTEPHFIGSNSWADYYTCQLIFDSDPRVKNAHTISFGHLGVVPELWDFKASNNKIEAWKPKYWIETSNPSKLESPRYIPITPDNLILIYSYSGILRRVNSLHLNLPDRSGVTTKYTLESTQLIPLVSSKIAPSSALFKELWKRTDK